ncbi:MAG TPA: hypothetical protein VNG33_01600 [Polyangiaceae bacterium]|nr:hypothetical protein [Polyangiaceae bacterium]
MATLILEGGFPVFFLLAFGLAALAFAVRFATAPSQRVFRTTLALSAATLFTSINGIFAAFSAVGHHAPEYLKHHPASSLSEVILLGMGESMSPGILGFTLLSLIALILALGVYRQNPV